MKKILLILILFFSLWANAQNEQLANNYFDRGDFEKALFLKPDCKEAIIKMGDILFKNKKIPEALIHYKNAYNISQDSVGLLGKIIHSKMSICDWSDYDELKNQIHQLCIQFENGNRYECSDGMSASDYCSEKCKYEAKQAGY